MNTLVSSGTPGKGGPSESEESEEEVPSLCKKLEIRIKPEYGDWG